MNEWPDKAPVGVSEFKKPKVERGRNCRRPKNGPERAFWDWAVGNGYQVMRRGWPDYMVRRPDGEFFVVEVKPTKGVALKAAQEVVLEALSSKGVMACRFSPDVGIERVFPPARGKPTEGGGSS